MATGITHVYANFLAKLAAKTINFASDTLKATLHTSTYAPNYGTNTFQSDLTNELPTAGGYTAGGNTLTGVSATLQASSALTAWAATTAYVVGEVRRKVVDNGHVFIVLVAGTSGGVEPTWQTAPGANTTDGTVTWGEAGSHVLKLIGTIPAWTSATFTCRFCVVADTTPGTAATNPLIAAIDFQADQSPSAGTFTVTTDADGIVVIPIRAT